MTTATRPYGGMSAEARRHARREQLLSGVPEVVGRDGVSGATVDAVCAAAGLTKRYFYESFTNLDAALAAAMDGAFTALRDLMTSATAALDTPPDRARAVVEILVDSLAADARLTRLYVESPGHAALRARREMAIADFTDLMRSDAVGIGTGIGAPGRQLLAVRLVVAGTTDLVTGWLSGVITAEREAIIDTIVAAGLAVSSPD